jgi:hypothetical protein
MMIFAFALCVLFFGMYYEFCGAVMTVTLAVAVCLFLWKNRKLEWKGTVGMLLYLLFLFGYAVSIFYGTDSGMAFLGIGKVLWIFPFLLLYQQMEAEGRERLFAAIPWIGSAATAVGLLGAWIPGLKDVLWVNGRLGGFFQYPNTMAVFLLAGVILLLYAEGQTWKNLLCVAVLCAGIAATGSRTAMVLSVLSVVVIILRTRKWRYLLLLAAVALAGAAYIVLTGDTSTVGRILKISVAESTLVGRILYAEDALPLLLSHPFGMGYLGYYYSENMVQTGVYTVRFVHNDWLQIGLDIGWIPMLAYLLALLKGIFGKQAPEAKKWVLAVVFLHGLLDFDLSYTVMLCLVLLILDDIELPKIKAVVIPKTAVGITMAALVLLGGYLAVPTLAGYWEQDALAAAVFPWDTEANLKLLSEAEDIDEVEALADRILRQNDTCALAYYAKAVAAYYVDDYDGVITFQKAAIARDYYNYEEYLNYAAMLYDGIAYGADAQTQENCREELSRIPDLLDEAKAKQSSLGKKIADQPELEIDDQLQALLDAAG